MKVTEDRELHLFIVWEKARQKEKEIIDDIKSEFSILEIYNVKWSKKLFPLNLTRFYGTNLPPGSEKEKHCGNGPFLLIIVEDKKPQYDHHVTSKGQAWINSNSFLAKSRHRSWTGGGHKIHATNTQHEFNHDITLLLGCSKQDYLKSLKRPNPNETKQLRRDLVGSDGWRSIEQYFYVLNHTTKYIVMRNYEPLPDSYYADKHGDIDLLVSDYDEVKYISNAEAVFSETYRVHNKVKINKAMVLFDFRYIGDGYYDSVWQERLLDKRVLYKGLYVPSKEDHFYSLLYHALIHKPQVAADYIETLNSIKQLSSAIDKGFVSRRKAHAALGRYMAKESYNLTIPDDVSVYVNHKNFYLVRKAMWRTRPLKFALKKAKSVCKKIAS